MLTCTFAFYQDLSDTFHLQILCFIQDIFYLRSPTTCYSVTVLIEMPHWLWKSISLITKKSTRSLSLVAVRTLISCKRACLRHVSLKGSPTLSVHYLFTSPDKYSAGGGWAGDFSSHKLSSQAHTNSIFRPLKICHQ